MEKVEKKVIGIIGGMGPLATVDLFQKIVQHTAARRDQDHLRILVDNNTNIPDRTAAILQGGGDPVPQMVVSAQGLEAMGAQLLVMPCNTAHHFHAQIQAAVGIPLLHMIDLTCRELLRRGVTCAGLLATDGTLHAGIYQQCFAGSGIQLLQPAAPEQQAVMDVTYNGVKAGDSGYDTGGFCAAMDALLDRGAQTLILGCTELPIAMSIYHLDYPTVDPTLVLAQGAILAAGGTYLE